MSELKTLKGIDVSEWQGTIDWGSVAKQGIDFAILRAGYGRYVNQEDHTFAANYTGATTAKIPVGIYWYAYATTPSAAKQEAETCLKILRDRNLDYPIYYDIEESSIISLGKAKVSAIAQSFADVIEAAGYEAGIYSMASALNTAFTDEVLTKYSVWVAHVDVKKPNVKCAYKMWQYTWKFSCKGIAGQVDADEMYVELPDEQPIKDEEPAKPETPKKSNETLAQEVIQGKWGNGADRVARLTSAGYDAKAIQKIVDSMLKEQKPATPSKPATTAETIIQVAYDVIKGKYGNGVERSEKLSAKGYNATNVQKVVNAILRGQPIPPLELKAKTIDELAREVIAGIWGNGETRKQRLTAAGYSYIAVQQRVNQLLK